MRLRRAKQFRHANHLHERRVLDERNHFVSHRRRNIFDHLRQYDAEKGLRLGIAQNVCRLILSFGNRLNATAIDFRKIRRVVHAHSDNRRHKSVIRHAEQMERRKD